MMSLRDKDGPSSYTTKQEVGDSSSKLISGGAASSSSSRQWSSGFKNPRIVRVSRTFGGKDRHSKVCTIKGLRDRRIRLSVPTAIQLYDLQDRLGLSQPSKVIDWLLETTKLDIDKLPPLPVIPGSFNPSQGYGLPLDLSSSTPFFDASLLPSRKECGININTSTTEDVDEEDESIVEKMKYWNNSNALMRSKQKEVDHHHHNSNDHQGTSQVLAQNLFPIASSNSTNNNMLSPHHPPPSFLSNNPMFNYYHLEPSNLSLSQLGGLGLPSSHNDHHHHHQGSSESSSTPQPPSSLSLSSMSQFFLCPSMPTASFLPPQHHPSFMNHSHHHNAHQVENDLRQFNRFPLSNNSPFSSSSFHNNSSGLDMKPAFPLSMNHDNPHLQQNDDQNRQGNKGSSSHNPWKESSGN